MNGSMNFGNIGFSTVSGDNSNSNNEEVKEEIKHEDITPANVSVGGMPDLMAGVKEAEEQRKEEQRKLEEEASDFKKASKKTNFEKDADNFSQIDFGPLQKYLDDDDITDISYSNNGQLWLKSLEKGVYRADQQDVDNELIEKIAFQCSNVMGKTFNMAHPFLDSESAELRMNFVHDSIARNGIAVVFRKTPAKIRLEKQKLLNERYIQLSIHDFLINCVKGHCNIIVCGETGSGKTELVKYLASHTAENEKLITIEDTLELHLDRIYPHRDIVAMKTNNIASYSDVLVTCMRQNPKWILLSEVRSAEAVTAVRNSISSGHYILSTIHADKAESIPHRMYSLLESNIDVEQFLKTIYRYVQIGVFVRGRYSPQEKRFVREIAGVCEFFVTDDNEPQFNNIYLKNVAGEEFYTEPTKYIKTYLEGQGIDINNLFGEKMSSLAEANRANGVECDVKEAGGETVHIPGKVQNQPTQPQVNNDQIAIEKTVSTENTINSVENNVPTAQETSQPVVQDIQNIQPMAVNPPVMQDIQNVQPMGVTQPVMQDIQNVQPMGVTQPVMQDIQNVQPMAVNLPVMQDIQNVQPMGVTQPVMQDIQNVQPTGMTQPVNQDINVMNQPLIGQNSAMQDINNQQQYVDPVNMVMNSNQNAQQQNVAQAQQSKFFNGLF